MVGIGGGFAGILADRVDTGLPHKAMHTLSGTAKRTL